MEITRLLGRRYFLMEKARDASIVGTGVEYGLRV
jgi:hypothetical protein